MTKLGEASHKYVSSFLAILDQAPAGPDWLRMLTGGRGSPLRARAGSALRSPSRPVSLGFPSQKYCSMREIGLTLALAVCRNASLSVRLSGSWSVGTAPLGTPLPVVFLFLAVGVRPGRLGPGPSRRAGPSLSFENIYYKQTMQSGGYPPSCGLHIGCGLSGRPEKHDLEERATKSGLV